MKKIFLIYTCDEWKSAESERLAMATTSKQKVKRFVTKEILSKQSFTYGATDDSDDFKSQSNDFRRDWDCATGRYHGLTLQDIDRKLEYGRIESVDDGEEL